MTESFRSVLAEVEKSNEFKKYKEKNKDSFLFSAFFVILPDFSIETRQLDYFIKSKKKVVTFSLEIEGLKQKEEDFEPKGELSALNEDIKIEISDIKRIIEKEIKKQNLAAFDITKVIAILQKWCSEFRSRSPLHYYGREERPNTGLADKSLFTCRGMQVLLYM